MKTEEAKSLTTSLREIARDNVDMAHSVSTAIGSTGVVKKLWKSENKSILVKTGVALLVFPEPVVSDVLGTALLAAGAVQEGLKRKAIYLDDLPKAFRSVIGSLNSAKELI